MGTILDKLDHLEETKRLIREELNRLGSTITDEDTFRSYVDKINSIDTGLDSDLVSLRLYNSYPGKLMNFPADELGEVESEYSSYSYFIHPEINSTGTYSLPRYFFIFRDYLTNFGYETSDRDIRYVDLSSINAKRVILPPMFVYGAKISRLILPPRVDLRASCFRATRVNSSAQIQAGYMFELFTGGIIFRGNVTACSSTWCVQEPDYYGNPNYVYLAKEFTGTLYLSKFNLLADTMVNMFKNLADLTDTGNEYTLNLGSTNLNKLTQEQQEIATNKGWKLT